MARLLRRRPHGPTRLRELLAAGQVRAPGAYDGLSARLVEQAGFDAVYLTGFGTAAGRLGRPDVGLLDLSEMTQAAAAMVAATDLPVVADADTGYGNALNVIRTVQEYERAGVAAIQLEDQVAPKRCGHMEGKSCVAVEEFEGKIRAAVAARSEGGPLIIARTDARAVEGLDAALERARRYHRAGAELIFVEAPGSIPEVEQTSSELAGIPLVFNWVEGGRTPPVGPELLAGFALVIFPLTSLLAATAAIQSALADLKHEGVPPRALSFDQMTASVGLDEIDDLGRRFA